MVGWGTAAGLATARQWGPLGRLGGYLPQAVHADQGLILNSPELRMVFTFSRAL